VVRRIAPRRSPWQCDLSEFDFRYSNRVALGIDDTQRREIALKGITGKRLHYRWPRSADHD
jgi:hypothetical protein